MRYPLSANMSETAPFPKFNVEGEQGLEVDERDREGPGSSNVEVVAKATRRRLPVEYKRKILRVADGCRTPGTMEALLRRESLYSSHLATWRVARDRGELAGAPKKRGPIPQVPDPRDKKIAELAREAARWRRRAERAEALVEVQKKLSVLLEAPLEAEHS